MQTVEKKGKIVRGESFQFIVEVVDAFGLSLSEDNVHIDVKAILELGRSMHDAYSKLLDAFELRMQPTIWRDFLTMVPGEPCYSMLSKQIIDGEALYRYLKNNVEVSWKRQLR